MADGFEYYKAGLKFQDLRAKFGLISEQVDAYENYETRRCPLPLPRGLREIHKAESSSAGRDLIINFTEDDPKVLFGFLESLDTYFRQDNTIKEKFDKVWLSISTSAYGHLENLKELASNGVNMATTYVLNILDNGLNSEKDCYDTGLRLPWLYLHESLPIDQSRLRTLLQSSQNIRSGQAGAVCSQAGDFKSALQTAWSKSSVIDFFYAQTLKVSKQTKVSDIMEAFVNSLAI